MRTKKSAAELLRRWLFLVVSLFVMALGVACSIQANLGTSPISSVPYAVSRFTPLTVGTATIAMHCVFILIQILILRRRYDPVQLLQLPVAIVFGYLTDLAVWAVGFLQPAAYWQQWLLCLAGILLVGVGVSFEVTAGVATMAGEGVVLAICLLQMLQTGINRFPQISSYYISLIWGGVLILVMVLNYFTEHNIHLIKSRRS